MKNLIILAVYINVDGLSRSVVEQYFANLAKNQTKYERHLDNYDVKMFYLTAESGGKTRIECVYPLFVGANKRDKIVDKIMNDIKTSLSDTPVGKHNNK